MAMDESMNNLSFHNRDCFSKIGTTSRGIGPTYSSKCFRNGVRVTDLMEDLETFEDRCEMRKEGSQSQSTSFRYLRLVSYYRNQFPNIQVDEDAELAKFKVCDGSSMNLSVWIDLVPSRTSVLFFIHLSSLQELRAKLESLQLVGDTVGYLHK